MSNRSEQRREEQNLFEAFLEACPSFAGREIRECDLTERDPPDVICVDVSGRHIGIEICQWTHQGEMKAGRLREKIEQNILEAIGPQPANPSANFSLVVFFPKSKLRLTPTERPRFQKALFQLIAHVDGAWIPRGAGQYYRFKDLHLFPPLEKYLELVVFVPGAASISPVDWIVPSGRFEWFNDSTMLDPLLELLRKKQARCSALKTQYDELHLVIAYDQALPYCSPAATPRRSVQDIATEAATALSADRGPFSGVFLLVADEPRCRVYRLL